MYKAAKVSGASGSNIEFHPARRVIRWKELTAMEYLADGAMCSCYTAHLKGHGTVVVKKPSRRSNEVSPRLPLLDGVRPQAGGQGVLECGRSAVCRLFLPFPPKPAGI